MRSRWEIWLDDPRGQRLALLEQAVEFYIQRSANEVGAFRVLLPGGVYDHLIRDDGLVEYWRAPWGGQLKLLGVGIIRKITQADDDNGVEYTAIEGPDQNDLLDRRIVAYAAGTAYTDKSDQADDLIKAIARENLGSSSTDADRNLSALSFTVGGNVSLGPNVEKKFSWRNVLAVMQDVAEAARQKGTELYFDLVPSVVSDSVIGFEFRTYINQIGLDRTEDSDNPVFFGKTWGNLQNAKMVIDRMEEVTVMYGGGQGEGSDREIVEVEDTIRSDDSPWNRREAFADARNERTTAGVTDKAKSELEKGRPLVRFSGDLVDTRQTRYGLHWEYGDRVTCSHRGRQFDGMIRAIKIGMSSSGEEEIEARIETSEASGGAGFGR
jgi:hypothetical protein